MTDAWTFDVATREHRGAEPRWSTVHISRTAYPDDRVAAEVAAQVAAHRGMPIAVLPVY